MSFWSSARPWLLPIVTCLGGLVAGILVFSLAPEAEGHGTDAAISAFHEGKAIRARIPIIKLVASAITIGTGGSAGREGPAAQISAGFGSILASVLHLDVQDRRIALATGMGAGIGAIFGAPLGGAILAAEILYKDDLELEALVPALIASIVGYSIFGAWSGWKPIFSTPANLTFNTPPQLLYYIVLGILCGFIGRTYARGFYGMTHIFHALHLPNWLKPAIGGLLVGLIGLVIPQALGMGYGWVQVSMGQGLMAIPLWIVLILPFTKIITTGLSIGSGGSGGIFGPGMVIGGVTGAAVWRLCYHVLPWVPATPAPFVIIGMMALFGGIAHAPLAVMLMVAEMTGNLSLLAPAMLAVGLSYLIVGQKTIYTSQLKNRSKSPAHRLQFSFPLLSTLAVRQAITTVDTMLSPQQSLTEATTLLKEIDQHGLPVINDDNNLLGTLNLEDILATPEAERESGTVKNVMKQHGLTILPDETLDNALEILTSNHLQWAPVVEAEPLSPEKHVIGILSVSAIVKHYRSMVTSETRRMQGLVEGTIMKDVTVKPEMRLANLPLKEAKIPADCLIVSIRRNETLLFPRGGTIIKPEDIITVMMSSRGETSWNAYLAEQSDANTTSTTATKTNLVPLTEEQNDTHATKIISHQRLQINHRSRMQCLSLVKVHCSVS